jgi:hypothetical protein
MPGQVPDRIHVYRLAHYANVRHILRYGLCHRGHPDFDPHYVNIGNTDIITKRVAELVGIDGYGDLGEYVPFYFSGKTPMLYNIKTGYGVPQLPQRDLVYIVCSFDRLVASGLQYVYTDGNAKVRISKRFTDPKDVDKLHWNAIGTGDFRTSVHGPDRPRVMHAEFLVRHHVPVDQIIALLVLDPERAREMETLVQSEGLAIKVVVDDKCKWFFP